MDINEVIKRTRFTVLLGKNGAGKSSLLRAIDSTKTLNTRYITPERGGTLKYEPGVDESIAGNPQWLSATRRQNRFESFRQQSASLFRTLELIYLRELERDAKKRKDLTQTFDLVIGEINALLPAIVLQRSDRRARCKQIGAVEAAILLLQLGAKGSPTRPGTRRLTPYEDPGAQYVRAGESAKSTLRVMPSGRCCGHWG